jgi:hypothetical protein
MKTYTINPWGFELTVLADVYPGEMIEPDYPGAPPMADIFHVYVGGVDIAEMLTNAQFARLEDHILRAEDYV